MTDAEKLAIIKKFSSQEHRYVDAYIRLLDELDDNRKDYSKYLTKDGNGINCGRELERLSCADYYLCTVLLTMLIREDHFCESFYNRYDAGDFDAIIQRMVACLEGNAKYK